MTYRQDIGGIRAIAVLSVLIFHFSHSWMVGGFAGVDIFFVVSGFLMTSIIFKGINRDNFSLIKFYYARVKRIIPALSVVVIVVLVIGYFICEPSSYKDMGWHGVSSLLFYSNYVYQNEVRNYFDLGAYYKFFLHTWTLSIEWQFYIVYPIIIAGIAKLSSRNAAKYSVPVMLLMSFIYCMYLTNNNPTASYYSTFTRVWEMLAGGIVCLFPINFFKKQPAVFEALGILLIVMSVVFINKATFWPSYYSLTPVLGACFILYANNSKSILRFAPIQQIGLWSYSMYLIHWPLIVIFRTININFNIVVYLALTILLSFVLYRLIERRRTFQYKLLVFYVITIILTACVSINGIKSRVPKDFQMSQDEYRQAFEGNNGRPDYKGVDYINGTEKNFDYILIGNSFARQYFYYIINNNIKVANFALDACLTTRDYAGTRLYENNGEELCKSRYKMIVEFAKKHPDKPIIISQRWADYHIPMYSRKTHTEFKPIQDPNNSLINALSIKELTSFIEDISKNSVHNKIYIVGHNHRSSKIMYYCLAKNQLLLSKFLSKFGYNYNKCDEYEKYIELSSDKALKNFSDNHEDVYYIQTSNALCKNGMCKVLENGHPIYTDGYHLSKIGSEMVGEYVFNNIKNRD